MNLHTDPHPECEHNWRGLGASAVCEPPVFHSACHKCRTFRHERRAEPASRYYRGATAKTWYSKDWPFGPWEWDAA